MPEPNATPDAPLTGQTGQEQNSDTGGRSPWFEVATDDSAKYHWQLWSGNGRAMATSVNGFNTLNDCTASIKSLVNMLRVQGGPARILQQRR